jgi:hypothetical protein
VPQQKQLCHWRMLLLLLLLASDLLPNVGGRQLVGGSCRGFGVVSEVPLQYSGWEARYKNTAVRTAGG